MTKRILYKTDDGGVAIIIPTPEILEQYTIEEVALKDVPAGKPFAIVNTDTIPTDRTFRGAWEVDETLLTDGVGAESNEFPPKDNA